MRLSPGTIPDTGNQGATTFWAFYDGTGGWRPKAVRSRLRFLPSARTA